MDRNILVASASKFGAAEEIGEKIGEVLGKAGLQVDVLPVESIRDSSSSNTVVLGSTGYVGKWQKGTENFLLTNGKTLAERPVWLSFTAISTWEV